MISYIDYGSQKLPIFFPHHARRLVVGDPVPVITEGLFSSKLEAFLEQSELDLTNPVLVVADKTRLCGYPEYLPVLVETLEKAGMNRENLKIIIAYGTHPPQSDEECLQGYGEIYNSCNFVHHDCVEGYFEELGSTLLGTPVRFRKDLLEASAIITMGAICHHYFAGYGGGRKLIFPGCGEKEAIYQNHSLYLDKTKKELSLGCQPGKLANNPLAEDLFEVEAQLPAHLAIHGILDSSGQLCDLLVGSGREHFLEACQQHGRNCEIESSQFDVVIASCGGFPKDINFIQTHKAIHNAAMFVKDGGQLILYSQCQDQLGSKTFLPWFEDGSFEEAFNKLSSNYEGNGGTALAMMTKTKRINIGMVTELDPEVCKKIGVEVWAHHRVNDYLADFPVDKSIACIPNSSLLVFSS